MSGELTPVGPVQPPQPSQPPQPPGWGGAGGWPPPPPPRSTPDDEIDLRELWAILRRNWWVVLGCTVLGLLAALAYVKLVTPVYRSSTTLQFQEQGSSVPVLDALRTLQGGTEVGTEMEVLRSRSLAEAVIDSLGLQVRVAGPRGLRRATALAAVQADAYAPEGRVRLVRGDDGRFSAELVEGEAEGELAQVAPGEPLRLPGATVVLGAGAGALERLELVILPRTLAAERFGEALGVSRPNRDANVVQVRFDAPDPELARDVANVLAHQYLVRRHAVQKVSDRSTVEFLRTQVDTLQVQLRAAEEAVRRFREANQVVNLAAEAEAQVERLAALQAQRAELEGERAALAQLLAEARAAAPAAAAGTSPYRRLLAFPTLLRNQTTATLLQALTARETELSQLAARRTPADPDYQAVAGQLEVLEEQATAVVTTYLGGLANQVGAIDRELAGFGQRMAQVPAKEVEYARLERSARVLADIYTLLQTRLKEAEVVEAVEDASVRVVDVAVVGTEPVQPRVRLVLLLATLLGMIVGCTGAVLRSRSDTVIRTREAVVDSTGLLVLALVPEAVTTTTGPAGRELGAWKESFGTLRTNLAFLPVNPEPRVIVCTSAAPGEGKTTTVANLGLAFARQGRRVIAVDADLRRGRLHEEFGVSRYPGVSELATGRATLADAVHIVDGSGGGDLAILATGALPPNPGELLASAGFNQLLRQLRQEYELVLIDAAPVNAVADATILGAAADGTLLIVRAGETRAQDLRLAVNHLQLVGVRILGTVLNAYRPHRGDEAWQGKYDYAPADGP